MKRIMIADSSEIFLELVAQKFPEEYSVHTFSNGADAAKALPLLEPDVLVINLFLEEVDGLSVIRQLPTAQKPLILIISPSLSKYSMSACIRHGADFFLTMPCDPENVYRHVAEMLSLESESCSNCSIEALVNKHLQNLGLNPAVDGTRQLRLGIPLFLEDQNQRLGKELYPLIANACRSKTVAQVEHSIREAIKQAWLHRDEKLWNLYFPGRRGQEPKCPTNKMFISRIALEVLKDLDAADRKAAAR